MSLETIRWFAAYFGLATVPLYCILLYVLLKHRATLKSSFFTICISVGVSDIWWTAHKTIFTAFPAIYSEIFVSSKVLAVVAHMGNWYIYSAQVMGIVLMAINRAYAMLKPAEYKTKWNSDVTRRVLVAHWLVPLPTAVPMLFPYCSSHYLDMNGTLYAVFDNDDVANAYFVADVIIELFIVCPLIALLYALMFYKVWKQQRSVTHQNDQTRYSRAELNLALTGALLSGSYLIYMLCWSYAFLHDWPFVATMLFFIWNDLLTCLNPYLLVALCTAVRKAFLNTVTCGKIALDSAHSAPGSKQKQVAHAGK